MSASEQPIKLILNHKKATQLTTVLQLLKAASETVSFVMQSKFVYIQVVDKSHVCLGECKLYYDWFLNGKELVAQKSKSGTFVLSAPLFHTIINSVNNVEQKLILEFTPSKDTFTVDIIYNITNKENINKHYILNLSAGIEHELLDVVEMEYAVEFMIGVKTLQDILSQMAIFGTGITMVCTEDGVRVSSSTDNQIGTVEVNISCNDFEEFAIDEGGHIKNEFNCTHLTKYCITAKLVPTVKLFIGNGMPMKICYMLDEEVVGTSDDCDNDEEKSMVRFFLSPKIGDIDDD